ncbi:hypothetical protein CBS101457_000794 [Exobasidium rhododendri]|nr:hypothetical protein CBS101457_000794 [Exobasidium rhododendri]
MTQIVHDDGLIKKITSQRQKLDQAMELTLHDYPEALLWCRLELSSAIANLLVYYWLGESEDYATILKSCRKNANCYGLTMSVYEPRYMLLEQVIAMCEIAISSLNGLTPPIALTSLLLSAVVNAWSASSLACACMYQIVDRRALLRVLLKALQRTMKLPRQYSARRDLDLITSVFVSARDELELPSSQVGKLCWFGPRDHNFDESSINTLEKLSCGVRSFESSDDALLPLSSIPLDFFERFVTQYGASWEV